jgi:hypothetical protein
VTAVMYRLTGLTRSFDYGINLQPEGVIHNNFASTNNTDFSTCDPRTSQQLRLWTLTIQRLDALGSLKHVSFDSNHLCQFITLETTKTATKHVKISFCIRIHSTLTFTHVNEYDRRICNDTQTEYNEEEIQRN